MSVDQTIKDVGIAATIVRTSGNLSTYVYIYPKAPAQRNWERESLLPTDSGLADGDLILASGKYYLVTSWLQDERVGEVFLYKAKLICCNDAVSVKAYSGGNWIDEKTNVPCLILDGTSMAMSDRGIVVPGFSGKDDVHYLYIQSSAGVDRNSLIVDSSNRSLRVAGGPNPYYSKGLLEVPVRLEA